MKATKLIKDKGLKYAKGIVDSAPSNATEWNEGFEFQCGQSVEIGKAEREKYFVELSDIKRLVESLEIIEELDGFKGAKDTLFNLVQLGWDEFEHRYIDNWKCTKERLVQAIRDYESIYQPKCIHGFDVACLICGFGTVDGERVYRTQGAKNG